MNDNFEDEKERLIRALGTHSELHAASRDWIAQVSALKYSYNFTWLGRPIIQFPQDIVALQEIIWRVRPELIVETGIARGGSLIFYASMLELIGAGRVIGIDLALRAHNRRAIEEHPMARRIVLLDGSSLDEAVLATVRKYANGAKPVLIVLDSNHTHDHVLQELMLYSPLVTKDSYLVVLDTMVEDMPDGFYHDRPWGKGNNPKTAVMEFLKRTDRFVIDEEFASKLLITVARDGYLRCVSDYQG